MVLQPDHTASPVSLLSAVPGAVGHDTRFFSLEVEAIKSPDKTKNVGVVYIGTSDMNIATGDGVIKSLSAGEQWGMGDAAGIAIILPAQLFLQTATDNDGVQVRGLISW